MPVCHLPAFPLHGPHPIGAEVKAATKKEIPGSPQPQRQGVNESAKHTLSMPDRLRRKPLRSGA